MNTGFHDNQKNQPDANSSNGTAPVREKSRRVPLWQAITLPLVSVLAFLLLLEGVLTLLGIKPAFTTKDPFVGFASNAPLFTSVPGPQGRRLMATSRNKINYFNDQSFPLEKSPDTFRIFSLGGSTTYGRPYDDTTSFSGWIRELLPAADNHKKWEVINAGGISYASYRVVHLMEELVRYKPDLFIIYTGQNEFLEERTYGEIRDMSPLVRTAASLLNRTRTWSAMSGIMQTVGLLPQQADAEQKMLGARVNTILENSAGLDYYTRDDALREKILEHYRISLERMVTLARSVDARVIFVTPASNRKDCTPFKSQHTPGLDPSTRVRVEEMLAKAKEAMEYKNWQGALNLLAAASDVDPRHAELQYRRGQALLALERFDDARTAFRIACDEDVCPLRALSVMRQIVTEIARDQGVGLVDYVAILQHHMQATEGHSIPGEELFLDHVHPTVEGHKMLALALIEKMIEEGLVHPGAEWNEQTISNVSASIEGQIDKEAQSRALANLAQVLMWAGKHEEAARTARRAQEIAGETPEIAAVLSTYYVAKGKLEQSMQVLFGALESAPGAPGSMEVHLRLAESYMFPQLLQLEKAAVNFLLFSQYMQSYDRAHELIGYIAAKRGHLGLAYASIMEALRLNPDNTYARENLAKVRNALQSRTPNPTPPQVMLDYYPSGAPRNLAQVRPGPGGRPVIDGIKAEFYENGRVKYFADVVRGELNGIEMTWDPDGLLSSRKEYRNGVVIVKGSG
jgi:tetratricopeptide (TPR) repeat protein